MNDADVLPVPQFCECQDWRCSIVVWLPAAVAAEKERDGLVLIAGGCRHGAELGEELVREGDGWKFVRPSPE